MSRIGIVNSFYFPNMYGGAEFSVKYFVETLISIGHCPFVICTHDSREVIKEFVDNIEVIRVPQSNFYFSRYSQNKSRLLRLVWHLVDSYNVVQYFRFKRLFKQYNPDLVFFNNLQGISISILDSLLKIKRIPIVYILRDYYILCPKTTMYKNDDLCKKHCIDCRILFFIKQRALKKSNYIIGISQFVLDKYQTYTNLSHAKTFVLSNFVISPAVNDSIKEYSFGYIGRIEKIKGIELLLNLINENKIKDKILVAGQSVDNTYLNYLKAKFENSNIYFTGQINTTNFFPKIKFCIVPSLWEEPFGRVIIESFSFGVPVIAHRIGGISELISNSQNGFLYENEFELLSLLKKLSTISLLKYKILSNNSLLTYFEKYSPIIFKNRISKILNEILN